MTDEIIENTADAVISSSSDIASIPENVPAAQPPEPPAVIDDPAPYQLPDRPADIIDPDWFNQLADNHQYLHAEINAIAPIDGISGGAQDIRAYQISFKAEATEEQRAAAYARLLELPVELKRKRARESAFAAVDLWFNDQIAAGFTGPNNIKMGLKTEDIALLTGNFIMSQQAALLGMQLPPVIDMNGLAHFFANIEELTQVMLAYGQHRSSLAMFYAARKAAVEAEFAAPLTVIPDTIPAEPSDSSNSAENADAPTT
jgi:hypothetical protein